MNLMLPFKKSHLTYDPAIPLFREVKQKRNNIYKRIENISTKGLMATAFITAKNETHKQIVHIPTMEHYSAIKREATTDTHTTGKDLKT